MVELVGIGRGMSKADGGAAAPPSSLFFNLDAGNSTQLKTAITNSLLVAARSKVLIKGNSTEWGAWANGVDSTGLKSMSVPVHLATLLNAEVCPTSIDNWVGCGDKTTNAQMKAYDPRITGATTWNPGAAAAYAIGGQMFNCVTNSAALGLLHGNAYDTIEVIFANPAVGGNFDIGTATTGVLQNVARDAGLATNVPRSISVAVGSTVTTAVQITNKSTTAVNIMSVNTHLAGTPKLNLFGAGIPGASSVQWTSAVASFPYAALAGIPVLDPDWSFIELSINDPRLGTSIPTYKTNIQALIDADRVGGGGVALVVGNQRYTGTDTNINNGTETSLALQQTYRGALYELATLNDIPLIDMWTLLGDWDALNALGYMATETGGFASPSHLLGTVAHPGNQAKAAVYKNFFAEVAAL